jgi:TonB family protein
VSTGSKGIRRALASLVVLGSLTLSSFAQSASTDEAKRKVKSRVTPTYPDLAKRMNVTGKAKIEVVISPDGRVKAARPVGGHPLLTQACLEAVQKWKFVAAPEETTQIVECQFSSGE